MYRWRRLSSSSSCWELYLALLYVVRSHTQHIGVRRFLPARPSRQQFLSQEYELACGVLVFAFFLKRVVQKKKKTICFSAIANGHEPPQTTDLTQCGVSRP
jgi:hypothetical protein